MLLPSSHVVHQGGVEDIAKGAFDKLVDAKVLHLFRLPESFSQLLQRFTPKIRICAPVRCNVCDMKPPQNG